MSEWKYPDLEDVSRPTRIVCCLGGDALAFAGIQGTSCSCRELSVGRTGIKRINKISRPANVEPVRSPIFNPGAGFGQTKRLRGVGWRPRCPTRDTDRDSLPLRGNTQRNMYVASCRP